MNILNKLMKVLAPKIITRCGACLYWERSQNTTGRCHRRPPTCWHFDGNIVSEFPLVNALNYCGEASRISDDERAERKKQIVEDSKKTSATTDGRNI